MYCNRLSVATDSEGYASGGKTFSSGREVPVGLHTGVRFVVEFVLAVFASAVVAYGPRLVTRGTAVFGTVLGIFLTGLLIGAVLFTILWGALLYLLYATGRGPVQLSDLVDTLREGLGWTTGTLSSVEERYEEALDEFEKTLDEIREVVTVIEADADIDASRLRTGVDRVATRLEALDRTASEVYDIEPESVEGYKSWDRRFQVALEDLETAVLGLPSHGRAVLGEQDRSGGDGPASVDEDALTEWVEACDPLSQTWTRQLKPKTQVLVNEVIEHRNVTKPGTHTRLNSLSYIEGKVSNRTIKREPPEYAKTAVVVALVLVGAMAGAVTRQTPLLTVALGLGVLVVAWLFRSRTEASIERSF